MVQGEMEDNSIQSPPRSPEKQIMEESPLSKIKAASLSEDLRKLFYQLIFLALLLGIFVIWKARGSYTFPTFFLEDCCSTLCSMTSSVSSSNRKSSTPNTLLSLLGVCTTDIFDVKIGKCKFSEASIATSTFWSSLSFFLSNEVGEIILILFSAAILHFILNLIFMRLEYVMKKLFGIPYIRETLISLAVMIYLAGQPISYLLGQPIIHDGLPIVKNIKNALLPLYDQGTKYIEILFPTRQIWIRYFYYHYDKTFIPDLYIIFRYMVALFLWGLLFQLVLLPFEILHRIYRILFSFIKK